MQKRKSSSATTSVVVVAEQRCILEQQAVSNVKDKKANRCIMNKHARSITSILYPYVGTCMRMLSPLTITYNVGDKLCSSHYNFIKRLRSDDLSKMQSIQGDAATGSGGANKRKTSLVEYFQGIRPDENSSTEDGSVLQQLNLLIHTSICLELISQGYISVSKAKEKVKTLCLKHIESTTDNAIRKRTERLLYDSKSKTSLLSFISDVSFIKVAFDRPSSAKLSDNAAVDPELSHMRYDGFEASPDSSSDLAAKRLNVNPALLLQVCLLACCFLRLGLGP